MLMHSRPQLLAATVARVPSGCYPELLENAAFTSEINELPRQEMAVPT